MADLINNGYQGVNITVGITGLPITITGQVCSQACSQACAQNNVSIVTLKLSDGKIVNIADALIAFFF